MKRKWLYKSLTYVLATLLLFSNVSFAEIDETPLVGGYGSGEVLEIELSDDIGEDGEDESFLAFGEEGENNVNENYLAGMSSKDDDDDDDDDDDEKKPNPDGAVGDSVLGDTGENSAEDNTSEDNTSEDNTNEDNTNEDSLEQESANEDTAEPSDTGDETWKTTGNIATVEELVAFAETVNKGYLVNYGPTSYTLTSTSYDLANSSWDGIGIDEYKFDLTLTATTTATITLPDDAFLFGYADGATIENITIQDDNDSDSTDGIGGFIMYGKDVTMNDCTNKGRITNGYEDTNYSYYGSMIAYATGSCELTKCINEGTVVCANADSLYMGGLIGYATGTSISLDSCENEGTVTGSNLSGSSNQMIYVGGLVGYTNATSNKFEYCNNKYTVMAINWDTSSDNGAVSGGFVGYANTSCSFTACTNTGNVYADGGSSDSNNSPAYAGGLIGYAYAGSQITSCSNQAKVDAETYGTKNAYAGGLIGCATCDTLAYLAISDCANTILSTTGGVLATSSSGHAYAGGIVGYAANGSKAISGSTNDSDISAETTGGSSSSAYAGGIAGWLGECSVSSIENTGGAITATSAGSTGYAYAGGLIAYVGGEITSSATGTSSTTISNLSNAASVTGDGYGGYIGGLIGKTEYAVTLNNAKNTGIIELTGGVSGYNYAAGLIGFASGSNAVENSSNTGNVSISGTNSMDAGGFIGWVGTIAICDSTNSGNVSVTYSETYTGSNIYTGGFVGYTSYTADTSVVNSSNSGSIRVTAAENSAMSTIYTGGLIGFTFNSSDTKTLTLTNNINTGDVTVSNTSTATVSNSYTGGLIGSNSATNVTLNCANAGTISDDSGATTVYVGGLYGSLSESSIDNSYNMGSVSSASSSSYVGGLVGYIKDSKSAISYSYNVGYVESNNYASGLVGYFYSGSNTITSCYNGGYVNGLSTVSYGICPNTNIVSVSNSYYIEQDSDSLATGTGTKATYTELTEGDMSILNSLGSTNWAVGSSTTPAFPTLKSTYSGTDYETYASVSAAVVVLDVTNEDVLAYSPTTGWTDSDSDDIEDTYTNSGISKYVYIPSGYTLSDSDDSGTTVALVYKQYSIDQTIDLSKVYSEAVSYSETDTYASISGDILTISSELFKSASYKTTPYVLTVNCLDTNSDTIYTIEYSIIVKELTTEDFVVTDDTDDGNDWTAEPWNLDGQIKWKTVDVADKSVLDISEWTLIHKYKDATPEKPFGYVSVSIGHSYNNQASAYVLALGTFDFYLNTGSVTLGAGTYTLGSAENDTVYSLAVSENADSPIVYYESGIPFYIKETDTSIRFVIKDEDDATDTSDDGGV